MERGRELMGKSRSKSPKLSMIFSHSAGMINCDNVPAKDKTITGVVSASSNNPDLAEPLIESEDHHTDNPSTPWSAVDENASKKRFYSISKTKTKSS